MKPKGGIGLFAGVLIVLAARLGARHQSLSALPADAEAVAHCEGSSDDPQLLAEKTLQCSPNDPQAHLTLIGCYFGAEARRGEWVKHLFWLIDHHPESVAFDCCGLPQVYLGDAERGWYPPPELSDQYRRHWEQAVAARPRSPAVLFHAAWGLGTVDPNLGLAQRLESAVTQHPQPRPPPVGRVKQLADDP